MMKAASGPKQQFRPLFLRILRDRAHLQDPPAPSWPTWGQCHCRMLVPYFYLLFPALFNELFYNLIMHEYSDIPFLKKKKKAWWAQDIQYIMRDIILREKIIYGESGSSYSFPKHIGHVNLDTSCPEFAFSIYYWTWFNDCLYCHTYKYSAFKCFCFACHNLLLKFLWSALKHAELCDVFT